jgi:hypothetical protein
LDHSWLVSRFCVNVAGRWCALERTRQLTCGVFHMM